MLPNRSARLLPSDPAVLDHRHCGPADGLRNIDSVVGRWCKATGLPYYVHFPSLVQHIGEASTLWSSGNRGRRRARVFAEDANGLLGDQ